MPLSDKGRELLSSQHVATCPNTEQYESIPCSPTWFRMIHHNILPSVRRSSGWPVYVSTSESCMQFSPKQAMSPNISFPLISSP